MLHIDKNLWIGEGFVGDKVRFMRASNGSEYVSFILEVSHSKKIVSDNEDVRFDRFKELIRIIVFKKQLVAYLKSCGLKKGMRVNILGKLHTTKTEYKGIDLIQIVVHVMDVSVIPKVNKIEGYDEAQERYDDSTIDDYEQAIIESELNEKDNN